MCVCVHQIHSTSSCSEVCYRLFFGFYKILIDLLLVDCTVVLRGANILHMKHNATPTHPLAVVFNSLWSQIMNYKSMQKWWFVVWHSQQNYEKLVPWSSKVSVAWNCSKNTAIAIDTAVWKLDRTLQASSVMVTFKNRGWCHSLLAQQRHSYWHLWKRC